MGKAQFTIEKVTKGDPYEHGVWTSCRGLEKATRRKSWCDANDPCRFCRDYLMGGTLRQACLLRPKTLKKPRRGKKKPSKSKKKREEKYKEAVTAPSSISAVHENKTRRLDVEEPSQDDDSIDEQVLDEMTSSSSDEEDSSSESKVVVTSVETNQIPNSTPITQEYETEADFMMTTERESGRKRSFDEVNPMMECALQLFSNCWLDYTHCVSAFDWKEKLTVNTNDFQNFNPFSETQGLFV